MKAKSKLGSESGISSVLSPKKSFNTPYPFIKLKDWSLSFTRDQEVKEYFHSNKRNLNPYIDRVQVDTISSESLSLVDEFNILHILMH